MIGSLQNKITKYQDKVAYVLPRAIGGTITYDGDYATHTFLSSGKLNVLIPGEMEITLVGGGGGGKQNNYQGYCMGGGGGGQVIHTIETISSNIYDISIGAGGEINSNGGATYFYNFVANGGNTPNQSLVVVDGGISGTSKAGGAGLLNGYGGGGGGGSTAVGQDGYASGGWRGGSGGAGYLNYGGGGGAAGQDAKGLGVDGGGNGAQFISLLHATDASANTGGGGGGGLRIVGSNLIAGKGGSGIVIIRYKYK